ncbi:extracellular solute-binding protein [Gymnodinialimonas ceratoperidinii]|uniref:Extracellular solute-binding protein n=1 Tax=Gymnodinialimonas ceratoperidinii TaxID=2856823 RepID=A0A8F6YBN1_9RHOB|nr:extracellular solute-binding protein [Gymnodinialimonas ceratoperidinii]QXT38347.1 extracellular solute-binding protein [Gymnodinialimonas ceratoperidinii]
MSTNCFKKCALSLVLGLSLGTAGLADPQHGVAMYGEPALPADFTHLPYANPDAPTGGRIVTGEVGSFDSLNPHIRQGSTPWQLRFLTYESLLGRSWDEPFTLYGLLAESVDIAEDNLSVEFVLREEARFSDGSPVTVEDVIWSFETLGTEGHPRYLGAWGRVDGIEATGERSVRITLAEPDRELAMIMGLRPILKADQWEENDFLESGLDVIPISTAPYVVSDFEAGRYVSLTRNPDYWGADLPFRRGTNVIDEIRMEFFADGTAMTEAFTSGIVTTQRETSAQAWANDYDFPRVQAGEVILAEIPHQRPSGMTGYVMNTRRPLFMDWRVREAMIQAFNFEFINATVNGGVDPRITSPFSNSPLAMEPGPAEGRVLELLEPFEAELLPGAIEGYALPVSDGSARNRDGIRTAIALMEDAGYTIEEGVMTGPDGPVTFEILLQTGSSENDAITNIYTEALERLGIDVTVTRVDSAQFRERRDVYDYDMIYYRWGLSLSPGNEQRNYWGCEAGLVDGGRNLHGGCNPAIEAMIDEMLNASSQEDYRAAVRALDRILISGRYVVPFHHNPISRIAYDAELNYPDYIPIYGDWIGWQPDVWWVEEE